MTTHAGGRLTSGGTSSLELALRHPLLARVNASWRARGGRCAEGQASTLQAACVVCSGFSIPYLSLSLGGKTRTTCTGSQQSWHEHQASGSVAETALRCCRGTGCSLQAQFHLLGDPGQVISFQGLMSPSLKLPRWHDTVLPQAVPQLCVGLPCLPWPTSGLHEPETSGRERREKPLLWANALGSFPHPGRCTLA